MPFPTAACPLPLDDTRGLVWGPRRWQEFLDALTPLGYNALLQNNARNNKPHSITNAIFFRRDKFRPGWARHGSRTLLLQLLWQGVPGKVILHCMLQLYGLQL